MDFLLCFSPSLAFPLSLSLFFPCFICFYQHRDCYHDGLYDSDGYGVYLLDSYVFFFGVRGPPNPNRTDPGDSSASLAACAASLAASACAF